MGKGLHFAGCSHGRRRLANHGGGSRSDLLTLAGAHLHRLVRDRPLSGGGAQPCRKLAAAPTQVDEAPLAIALTYLGVSVALLLVVGIFVPVLTDQINGFIKFVTTAANAPEGPTEYIKGLAKQNGLGGLFQRFSDQLDELRKQLGEVLQNLLSASGQIALSVASLVAALATVLTLTFFLILGSERFVNAGVGLFPE